MSDRALVIGLDGMPRTLLHELAERGLVPHLSRLLDQGHCAELQAPLPEISSTSWASFLTGANPARHGIFGFVDLVQDGYGTYFPNVSNLASPPIWQYAEDAGLRTLCLNVPGTYPAPDMDGVVVSGFVSPNFDRAVAPARVRETLRRLDYELDVEVGDVAADARGLVHRAMRAMRARTDAFEFLLRNEQWELGVAVLTETDRVQHFLWDGVADPDHELHAELMDFYRLADECVGRLVATLTDRDELFLVSDHGFGPARRQFYTNSYLREAGWLAGREVTPQLSRLDGRTQAFALDPARIYLHRQERFPSGSLSESEAAEVADEIAAELLALRTDSTHVGPDMDGPTLISSVFRAREVYSGPLLDHAPDLLALPAPDVQLRGAWGGTDLFRPDALTGTHTREDAIFYRRGATSPATGWAHVDMADAAPSVLAAVGVDMPGVDGLPRMNTRPVPTPA